jgi:hypothetical protein
MAINEKLAMGDRMLREQARQFAPRFDAPNDFRYSNGWLANFKKRQGIKQVVLHGEASNADGAGEELARKAVPNIVEEGGYPADNIYSQDETGQFWRQGQHIPCYRHGSGTGEGQAVHNSVPVLQCHRHRQASLFVIGKAKRPRSLRENFQPQRDWGVRYSNNKMAWMMSADFGEWVNAWNNKLGGCGFSMADARDVMVVCLNENTHMFDLQVPHILPPIATLHCP